MLEKAKKRVHQLLDPWEGNTTPDRIVNTFIIALIISNVLAVILQTVDSIYIPNQVYFHYFEVFSISAFSLEYFLRLWTCTVDPRYSKSITGRLKFMVSFGAIIDMLAFLPFYLPFIIGYDLRFIRIVRLLRFFRFFKLGRYLNVTKITVRVFKAKREELVLSLMFCVFLIVIASSVMYFVEHDAQPDKFSSIPETMWWSVATLTTVGYGDLYPITPLGKLLTSCIVILGIGMFALPAFILASGFSEELKKMKKIKKYCPHCGEEIE